MENKNNALKYIGIVILVIILIIIGVFIFRNKGKKEVNTKEFLKVSEMNGKIEFDFKVDSIEKNHKIDDWYYTGDSTAIKVDIKNNSNKNLELNSYLIVKLLDSKNNVIAKWNSLLTGATEGSVKTEIGAGEEVTGNMYFVNQENGNVSNINNSDLKKMELYVLTNATKSGEDIKATYEEYFIDLD